VERTTVERKVMLHQRVLPGGSQTGQYIVRYQVLAARLPGHGCQLTYYQVMVAS